MSSEEEINNKQSTIEILYGIRTTQNQNKVNFSLIIKQNLNLKTFRILLSYFKSTGLYMQTNLIDTIIICNSIMPSYTKFKSERNH